MNETENPLVQQHHVVAGFIGAIIMVLKQKEKRSLLANIASVIAGTASATYLTPIVGQMLNQHDPNYLLGFAFLLGVLGLRSIEIISDYLGFDGKPGLDKPINFDQDGESK